MLRTCLLIERGASRPEKLGSTQSNREFVGQETETARWAMVSIRKEVQCNATGDV